jgi:hypothetical protein
VDLIDGQVLVGEGKQVLKGTKLPRMMLNLLEAGGAVQWYRAHRA